MTPTSQTAPWIDFSAIALSSLCLIHCLALPLLAVVLPLAGLWAEAEWVHQLFVGLAVLASAGALVSDYRRGRGVGFALRVAPGLALLVLGAFVEALHDYETALTVMGAIALAYAHGRRLRRA